MKPWENIVEKGENAGNHNIFYPSNAKFIFFKLHLFCCLQMLWIWTSLILSFGNENNGSDGKWLTYLMQDKKVFFLKVAI